MLCGKYLSSKLFSFHKKSGLFVSEASTLQDQHLGTLWSRTGDKGFVIQSAKTGNGVIFGLSDVERDSDGDVICWNYKGYSSDPKLAALKARVYND
jgi:hypothetical protein